MAYCDGLGCGSKVEELQAKVEELRKIHEEYGHSLRSSVNERDALRGENARLLAALEEACRMVDSWGDGSRGRRLRAIAEGKKP